MKLHLIRHGQKRSDQIQPELTDIGIQQASLTADYLAHEPITKVIASPWIRTQQTAAIIAKPHRLTIESDILLRERIGWQDSPKCTLAEFVDIWCHSTTDRDWDPPFGYSSKKASARMSQAISKHTLDINGDIVFVSHGGIITDFLADLVGENHLIANFFKTRDNYINSRTQECSITTLINDHDTWKLDNLFYQGHLDNLTNAKLNSKRP